MARKNTELDAARELDEAAGAGRSGSPAPDAVTETVPAVGVPAPSPRGGSRTVEELDQIAAEQAASRTR